MITLLSALLLASPAMAQDDAPAEEKVAASPKETTEKWQTKGWGWGGLPYVIYNSDDGVNVGVIGSLYKYNGEMAPYKTRIGFLASFTSKGILYDYIDVDALGLAGGKLRLTTRVLFDSRFSEPYCGLGGDVMCYDKDFETGAQEMRDYGVPEEDIDEDSVRRFYYMAYRQPYALAWARYELTEMPHKVELIASYRLSYFAPFDKYPHTKYRYDHGDDDKGFTSVLQGGVMVDNRDNEPSPWRGYWAEATVRGASKYWGSQFNWFGFNATFRGYLPIIADGKLTLADRAVFDGIVGEPSTREMDWMGGYQMYNAVGGARSMRGIRAERYRGRVKILNQAELRWRAYRLNTKKGGEIDFYLQAFLDAGMVAEEWADLSESPVLHGEGIGLRIAFNRNFILRGDFAFSPYESEGFGITGLYLDVDNLW